MVYLGPSFQIYSIQLTPKMDIEVRDCNPFMAASFDPLVE